MKFSRPERMAVGLVTGGAVLGAAPLWAVGPYPALNAGIVAGISAYLARVLVRSRRKDNA